jgi:aconitate hydratase
MTVKNSFNAKAPLEVGGKSYEIYRLDALAGKHNLDRLPYSIKILLENLLRTEDGVSVTASDIEAIAGVDLKNLENTEIAFTPSRVLMQDFTGVPAVVDLAAMRDAMKTLGGDTSKINPLAPAEMVIDHSVMVDNFGSTDSLEKNVALEFKRNGERYEFLRWGQEAFDNFRVVPPRTGIVHQVNLEHLARIVFDNKGTAYPDTVVGTDSHTTMINGAGVLGWGVGGIEAEAAMLGQPVTMLIPEVIGFRLDGKLPEGITATDLVLKIVEQLREYGVVGKFVEFFGPGLSDLPLADRATIANMAPEYGATCGIFPIDDETIRYLKLTGRSEDSTALVEAYAKAQGLWRDESVTAEYTDVLTLDMGTIKPSLAGPKRPQDRLDLDQAPAVAKKTIADLGAGKSVSVTVDGETFELDNGDVMIAAITSCTNTSNPSVIMAAGLVAQKAVAKGLKRQPWVKTSLAPGSKVVTEYLNAANLMEPLQQLGFNVVGYGCTTCIGNSGPLNPAISKAINDNELTMASVLSGNRNFEGRVHADVKMNFLASPPLVVAYALAGNMDINVSTDSLGKDTDGNDVYLKDIWPSNAELAEAMSGVITSDMFNKSYTDVFKGDERWNGIEVESSDVYGWNNDSTYVQNPPYFEGITHQAPGIPEIKSAKALLKLGDSITTDHISPAGAIKSDSPAGKYLQERNVDVADFNSYGSRRGNHEVMMRGTFANIRLRNQLAPGTEGSWTKHIPTGEVTDIYEASQRYQQAGTPLIVMAGKEYGTGSSRDWAAKGTMLLGVKAVITQSFERIHRSNLVGMGVLPLQFQAGDSHESLGLTGKETYDINDLVDGAKTVTITATDETGNSKTFTADVRIDTPKEWDYYKNGGILHYVLRQLAS